MAKGTSKPGSKSVSPSAKGSSPTHTVAGGPGKSFPQKPIAKPTRGGKK